MTYTPPRNRPRLFPRAVRLVGAALFAALTVALLLLLTWELDGLLHPGG